MSEAGAKTDHSNNASPVYRASDPEQAHHHTVEAITRSSAIRSVDLTDFSTFINNVRTRHPKLHRDRHHEDFLRRRLHSQRASVSSQTESHPSSGTRVAVPSVGVPILHPQVLKQEWPHNWPTFVSELVESSRTNLSLCENNMVILKLLSEEVFDYSAEQMTQAKIKDLKSQLCNEFSEIFQLCQEVLEKATKSSLIKATLDTLLRFLNWIPLGFIFETTVIDMLLSRVGVFSRLQFTRSLLRFLSS